MASQTFTMPSTGSNKREAATTSLAWLEGFSCRGVVRVVLKRYYRLKVVDQVDFCVRSTIPRLYANLT